MIVVSANGVGKAYGINEILKDVSFNINDGDKVGVIGRNGAGKTTLLNILSGEISATSGDFFISREKTVGFLRQRDNFDPKSTVYGVACAVFSDIKKNDKDRYESEITGILKRMAFGEEYYAKEISTLSGGERTRLALACLLLRKPNLLFLDEPTNYLDIGSLAWLEQYLKAYPGTVLLISHDRYLLDQTVNRVFEIENHRLSVYEGNYSAFAEKKRERAKEEARKYDQHRREIARQEDIIRRLKQHGTEKLAKRALSREKRLAGTEAVAAPAPLAGKIRIQFKQDFKSGNDVLFGSGLSKGYKSGDKSKVLFENTGFDIKRGEKICLVGQNGIGKTTLLKIITGEVEPDSGFVQKGHNVAIGYYDQRQALLDERSTLLSELKDAYRLYTDTEMRSIMGRFLFKDDSVFLKISSLSGGEKARLALLKLMLSGANTLVLDEPTNHLDIDSKEVFEDAVSEFPGTVIVVSHDRYFLNKIPDRIFELGREGITEYLGTYDYYMEKKESVVSGKKYMDELSGRKGAEKTSLTNEQRLAKKRLESEQRRQARKKSMLEEQINELEQKIADTQSRMLRKENISDHVVLTGMAEELSLLKQNLEEKYAEWVGLS